MIKKLFMGALLTLSTLFTGSSECVPFSFEYRVVASDNTASELVHLYEVKEYMLIEYDNLIMDIENDEISQVIYENYSKMCNSSDAQINYVDGVIEIIIGEGKGISLKGKFKSSYCDSRTINGRYYFIEEILR